MNARAWFGDRTVLYGNHAPVQKLIESATRPEKKVAYLASFAEMLWRMGQSEQVRAEYAAAHIRSRGPAFRTPFHLFQLLRTDSRMPKGDRRSLARLHRANETPI